MGPPEPGIDAWFASRTSRSADHDPDRLAHRKAEQQLTVSVVLPALDVADTVGEVVGCAVQLAGELVDEVVVVDGGSQDDTAEVAAAAGARVHHADAILPEHGPALGKGDALWRGLEVTSGDLVVYMDTDLTNPSPRFVWALLAPLLADAQVGLVKGFYDRPLRTSAGSAASGGGRVTELCARPLLNLHWPELAGVVQPLGGEYAGRRSLLEQLPYFSGYGVEIGLLIDVLDVAGAEAIAQVDLGERHHSHQELPALSRMAFAIQQVAAVRLAATGRMALPEGAPTDYVQFHREAGRVAPVHRELLEVERPPLARLRTG